MIGRALRVVGTGELFPLPCGRMSCPACSRRLAAVTAAMVGIDAAIVTPTVAMTTTTRDQVAAADLREGQRQMVRAIRHRVAADARYLAIVEWTTGRGLRAHGRRRPHFHSLWKALPLERVDEVREIAVDVWSRIAGADSHVVEQIRTPAAAVLYVGRHHLKQSQSPPDGWRGRRLRAAKGWWELGAAETRARAKLAVHDARLLALLELQLCAELDAAGVPDGLPEDIWDELLSAKLEAAKARRVEVVRVEEHPSAALTEALRTRTTEQRHRWRAEAREAVTEHRDAAGEDAESDG